MGGKNARRKKRNIEENELEVRSERLHQGRRAAGEPVEEPDEEAEARAGAEDQLETDDARDFDLDRMGGPPSVRESDARVVDDLTERIFRSVLARYGWERHGNRIEHVGEQRSRH